VLVSAFRAGQSRAKSMVVLGVIYAVLFLLMVAATALVDGGGFAKSQLGIDKVMMDKALLESPEFQGASLLFFALYVPFTMLFWHAPALVHWHGVTPVKSLFFSWVACWRNKAAMLMYALGWVAIMMASFLFILLLTGLIGGPQLAKVAMVPTTLLLATLFFVSMYFTYADTFSAGDAPAAGTA
jgi:hypothetical protein